VYGDYIDAWSIASIDDVTDVVIEVDVRFVEGSNDTVFGVIFNYQGRESFYFYEIHPEGFWDMVQYSGGEFIDLIEWRYASEIRQGKSVNHLRIELSQASTLYINDNLKSRRSIPYMRGGVGFWVATWSGEEVTVAFDNFTVSNLP
jgi:hypothetical protein